MSMLEAIWRWATLFLAEILNVSASAAEAILRSQTRWVAQLRLMADNLSAAYSTGEAAGEVTLKPKTGAVPFDATAMRQVLDSYAILNRTLRNLKGRGLALDDTLLNRMKREWNQDSIIAFLRSCDEQLKKTVEEALDEAAKALGPGVPNSDEIARLTPAAHCKPVAAQLSRASGAQQASRRKRELTN